ncbi:protein similar to mandelate racemase [Rubellimicrobium mesophilum DSM 19309]|uniref:Protein similar to mandelate racemase n=1 Tax=Rubellimicrobium mesophilum DSM 19309 TaxID=442562 RepID=A0A017HQ00_9RHOB|nr:protein similar to mandelate racemase [Rubellimicrobium mesophilum DSM 19309]
MWEIDVARRISGFTLTRFQFRRDRVIGDSQVRAEFVHAVAVELHAEDGETGLGFAQFLFNPFPDLAECEAIFAAEVFPGLEGQDALSLVHRVDRPRGGNRRSASLPFGEGVQVALWDLAARQAGLPLWRMLGARRDRVRGYASGLDFHLSDEEFSDLFGRAAEQGYTAFKIKVGHPEPERDLHRLDLLARAVGKGRPVMVDANEAWSPKEALMRVEAMQAAGHRLLWVEDPILRDDFDGLRMLRHEMRGTQLNSGEYLDLSGRRALLEARATDMLNVHGRIGEVMQVGWLAADIGIPVTLGNTFLELGVHTAMALPEVQWMEYSFQNYDVLAEEPIEIRDGWVMAPDRPGHGLRLSEAARRELACPRRLPDDEIPAGPACDRLGPGLGHRHDTQKIAAHAGRS